MIPYPQSRAALEAVRSSRAFRATVRLATIALAIFSTASLHAAAAAPTWAATPATPGDTTMLLDWNAASGAATYRVRYRTSESPEAFTAIIGLPLTSTSYTVTGIANQKSYEFQVGSADSANVVTWGALHHARPRASLHTSGLHAGGQVNGIVRAAPGFMVAATDVGGFQRSIDGGVTWRQASVGIHIDNGTHAAAAVSYHAGSGTLYGLSGGGSGFFYKSTDNGTTWVHQYTGNDIRADANSADYPRDVGRLIAIEPGNANTVYIATAANGVRKSTNGGTSWTALTSVLNGQLVNGVALDGGFLYAAVAGIGVYRCPTGGGAPTLFNGTSAPTNPEEILVLGGRLYVASNTAGIRRLNSAATAGASTAWTNLNVGGGTAAWCAIDGYISGTNHVIVVGNSNAEPLPTGRYTTVKKCTNAQAASGFTWTDISSATTTTVDIAMAAGNGETYWRTDATKGLGLGAGWGPDKRIDGSSFNVDQIQIDPDNTNKIHVVGQMGMWRTLNGGTSWQPAVVGLSNAVVNTIATDPINPGRVYVGDTDNGLWISDDYAESVSYVTKAPNAAKGTVFALDVDMNGLAYVGLESPGGGAWSYNRSTQTWTELSGANGQTLRDIAGPAGRTVHGIGVQHLSGTRVVLAAIEGSGIWRLAAGGNWTRVQSTTMNGVGTSTKTMPFAWPSTNKQLVYFFDQSTGVWRSINAGQSWTNIWSTGFSSQFAGSIALRSGSNSQLYVTTSNTLYRLNNADTANPATATDLGIHNAGKLAAYNDTLWIACYADGPGGTATDPVKLFKYNGTTFTPFTSTYYEGAMGRVTGLAVDANRQYVTSGPMGITVSEN